MKFSQEMLMAYADGELDAETRRAIEAEMAADPQVAQEIERQRALRAEVGAAFAGVLDEQVPDRLLRAATKATASPRRRQWAWPEWTSIAASLLIGVLIGRALLLSTGGGEKNGIITAGVDGRIVASGQLAQALSEQLSSEDSGDIDIGLTFRSKSGEYCRTFGARGTPAVVGFACRDAETWRVDVLSTAPRSEAGSGYRMASTQLPAPVVEAIAARMQGEALDADEEALARQRRWRE
jgi:hypothetical protein